MKLGVDITEVDRIAKSMAKKAFLNRIFTPLEQEYLQSKKMSPETAAGMFAAKEAFSKAVGSGIRGFSFTDIEVCHSKDGAPELKLYGGALLAGGNAQFAVSISHTKEYAVAVVASQDFERQTGERT